eukprot:scaffold1314_cov386-Pavlova_lutheri.AAC.13
MSTSRVEPAGKRDRPGDTTTPPRARGPAMDIRFRRLVDGERGGVTSASTLAQTQGMPVVLHLYNNN